MEHVINGSDDDPFWDDVVSTHLDDRVTTYELYGTPDGQIIRTHGVAQCGNYPGGDQERCALHKPTSHHMRDWPLSFRYDKHGLIERHCPHGVGHPDPDSADFFNRNGMRWMAVHGCDGCCVPTIAETEES